LKDQYQKFNNGILKVDILTEAIENFKSEVDDFEDTSNNLSSSKNEILIDAVEELLLEISELTKEIDYYDSELSSLYDFKADFKSELRDMALYINSLKDALVMAFNLKENRPQINTIDEVTNWVYKPIYIDNQ